MSTQSRIGVLFVCMGNICRSPTAEAVFRHLVSEAGLADVIMVDSAGTHGYHIGAPPDARSCAAAARRNYDLSRLRARRVVPRDFELFDYLLAMDRDNLGYLEAMRPPSQRAQLGLLLEYTQRAAVLEVPDPYYGGAKGFEHVLDLVEEGARGLLAHLQDRLSSS